MNIYHVSGKTQLVRDNRPKLVGEMAADIEANTPDEAAENAMQRYRDCNGDQNYEWNGKPNVRFVRELSEAEMMKRQGAPQLF